MLHPDLLKAAADSEGLGAVWSDMGVRMPFGKGKTRSGGGGGGSSSDGSGSIGRPHSFSRFDPTTFRSARRTLANKVDVLDDIDGEAFLSHTTQYRIQSEEDVS